MKYMCGRGDDDLTLHISVTSENNAFSHNSQIKSPNIGDDQDKKRHSSVANFS